MLTIELRRREFSRIAENAEVAARFRNALQTWPSQPLGPEPIPVCAANFAELGILHRASVDYYRDEEAAKLELEFEGSAEAVNLERWDGVHMRLQPVWPTTDHPFWRHFTLP